MLGDLDDTLGPKLKVLFKDRVFCAEFIGECMKSEDDQLKETVTWTQGMIGCMLQVS